MSFTPQQSWLRKSEFIDDLDDLEKHNRHRLLLPRESKYKNFSPQDRGPQSVILHTRRLTYIRHTNTQNFLFKSPRCQKGNIMLG